MLRGVAVSDSGPTFLIVQSLGSDGVRPGMPVRHPFGMSIELGRNHLQESICFARARRNYERNCNS